MQIGLPTDLIYLNRVIDNKYVQAPSYYKVSTINEFLEEDIQTVFSLKTSIIRPILGMFGSGKSTILNRVEKLLLKVVSRNQYLLIKIDLDNVPVVQHHEFINVIMKRIFPILEAKLFRELFENSKEEELVDIFQGVEIQKKIKKLHSKTGSDRLEAKAYFFDEIEEEKIFQTIEGVIKLAEKNDKVVIILIDELEYLINIDKDRVLTEIMVSRFLRGIIDRHNSSVYIVFTCYKEAYDNLKEHFNKFYRIVEGHEIKLGDLSDKEKRELALKLLDETMEYTFGKLKINDLLKNLKGRIDFYMGNTIKLIVKEVYKCIDLFQEIWKQTQKLYEKNARQEVVIPKLIEYGFKRNDIAEVPTDVRGYKFDIFANDVSRTTVKKRAFGEIKSVLCNKGWVEEFVNWMNALLYTKSGEYEKDRDHLLFVAPEFTSAALKLLDENNIKHIIYHDPVVENIMKKFEEEKIKDLTSLEKKLILWIKETKGKKRTLNVVKKEYNIEVLEELASKRKIEIKTDKYNKKHVHLIK